MIYPDQTDNYNIDILNQNFREIVESLETLNQKIENGGVDNFSSAPVDLESEDALEPSQTAEMSLWSSGREKIGKLFKDVSVAIKNIRYLVKLIGTTDISSLSSSGTVTGAVRQLSSDLSNKSSICIIQELTSINQLEKVGFYLIGEINQSLAESMGINNVGDYSMIVTSANASGGVLYFGTGFLFSPRLDGNFYYIKIWDNVPTAYIQNPDTVSWKMLNSTKWSMYGKCGRLGMLIVDYGAQDTIIGETLGIIEEGYRPSYQCCAINAFDNQPGEIAIGANGMVVYQSNNGNANYVRCTITYIIA